jgi:hypothetical protein
LGHPYSPFDYIRHDRPHGMVKYQGKIEWHVWHESTWWNTTIHLQARLVIPYLYHTKGEGAFLREACDQILPKIWRVLVTGPLKLWRRSCGHFKRVVWLKEGSRNQKGFYQNLVVGGVAAIAFRILGVQM